MRATEIFDLKGKDIRPETNSIFIEAKGGRRYEVFVADDVIKMLLHYRKGQDDYLFTHRDGGRLKQIPKTFNRVVLALGLMDGTEDNQHKVWFHVLRHTCITRWAMSGRFSLHQLMDAARHGTVEMTMRYSHLLPKATQSLIAEADRDYQALIQP